MVAKAHRTGLLARAYECIYQHADTPFVQRCLGRVAGPHLALGCGTGRELLPALAAGRRAIGIDMWQDMLEVARAKLLPQYEHLVSLECGDFTLVDLPTQVGLITCLSNTWPMVLARDRRKTMWRRCYDSLALGGLMLVVIVNQYPPGARERTQTFDLETGALHFRVAWDENKQTNLRTYNLTLSFNDETESHTIPTAIIPYEEMLADARAVNFTIDTVFGDYNMSPFSEQAPWQVIIVKK